MDLSVAFLSGLDRCGVGPDGRLGLAVSGGADSIALLHLAADCAARQDLRVHVLHVDHRLRSGSGADARFVETVVGSLGLPSTTLRPARRPAPGQRAEAWARELRYFALDAAARALGCRWVATAHTLDDQSETVLLRALRGTGTGGLGGIPPVRGRFVRPLLWTRRAELRSWLDERGLAWREDPTNADLRHERNWLRSSIVPLLEARRPGSVEALARLADAAREDAAHLDEIARRAYARVGRSAAGILVGFDELDAGPAVARRLVMLALDELGSRPDAATVAGALDVARSAGFGGFIAPGRVVVWRAAGGLAFTAPRPAHAPLRLPRRGTVSSDEWGIRIRVSTGRAPAWSWRCVHPGTDALWLRARRPGDRVRTTGGTRKVQDVLVDAKVPRILRDLVPILATDLNAVAVVGLTNPGSPAAGSRARMVVDVEPLTGAWWRQPGWWSASPAARS